MTVRNLFFARPRVAFVFSGGGNLGAIQVGQARALIERGIIPDAVVGCSVGALNGAAIACDPTPDGVERVARIWKSLARDDIFPTPGRSRGPWLYVRSALSAYRDDGLKRLISRFLRSKRFEDTRARFAVVATSLHTGIERWIESGDMDLPLLASTALPGVFPPVDIDGELYIDGGVVNNVPISKAFDMKAKQVYVLDVGNISKERRAPRRPYEVLMHAVSIAREHRFLVESKHVPEGIEMIRMPSIDVGKLRFDDFSRSTELMERSYRASLAFLDARAVVQSVAV